MARDAHVNVLVAANLFTDAMDQLCREEGITHNQYVPLFVLCLAEDGDKGLPIGAVADGLLNRASDTTRLVDRLENAGLVERLPNPADRRGVLVRAKPAGRALFERLTPRLKEFHRSQWAHLSGDELEQFNRLLIKALWGGGAGAEGSSIAS